MFRLRAMPRTLLICLLLAAGTVTIFWPVNHADFVNIDDPVYVAENLRVQKGLSPENVKWAFTTFYFCNWHPLTWLSYMADCQFFGLNAPAMHGVNLVLHVLNTLLLFLLLKRMTGVLWASGIVAALFAWHPLHVESVAWIAERKDVLSTFFGILTIWAYVEYARRRCWGWYAASLVLFALGLMSKAMLVTMPFALLLLDVWPLQRISIGAEKWLRDGRRLALEKLPFLAFAALSSYLTFLAQRQGESVISFAHLPFSQRFQNAIVSYVRYLARMILPVDLAAFYPHPVQWPGLQVVGAVSLVLTVSVVAIWTVRRWPFLFTGWFWFVGTLVPVIGLVQVGSQSMADRYTYIPLIGLFVALVWGARELVRSKSIGLFVPVVLCAGLLLLCGAQAHRQTKYWNNSLTLFSHAAKVTAPNIVLLNNLGDALLQHGSTNEATLQFRKALEMDPESFWAWGNLGNVLLHQGKVEEAIEHYRNGLRRKPNDADLHHNLGLALANKGAFEEAIREYDRAIALNGSDVKAPMNRGNAYMALGKPDAALTNYLAALELNPAYVPAHYSLGNACLAQNRIEEAIGHFSDALRLDGRFVDAHRQLAVALQQAGKPQEALTHLERAVTLKSTDPGLRAQLGALLGALGRTEAAAAEYREALKLAPDSPAVLNNLSWLLATDSNPKFRNGTEAVRLAERGVELSRRKVPMFLGTLAAAYAEAGRFTEATATANEAIALAESQGEKELAARNRELLEIYRAGKPWHEAVVQK